jgi:hypothetical protein
MTSPLKMILGFNYLNLCKNWIFHVIWPCRPFDDLTLIKGHNYCINREIKLSLIHDSLITQVMVWNSALFKGYWLKSLLGGGKSWCILANFHVEDLQLGFMLDYSW